MCDAKRLHRSIDQQPEHIWMAGCVCGDFTARNISSLLYSFLAYVAFGINQNSEALHNSHRCSTTRFDLFTSVFNGFVLGSEAIGALVKAHSTNAILPDMLGSGDVCKLLVRASPHSKLPTASVSQNHKTSNPVRVLPA